MKIGYIAQLSPEVRRPPFDGPANHIRFVVAELKKRGHQVRLVASIEGEILSGDDPDNLQAVNPNSIRPSLAERSLRKVQSISKLPYFNYFDSRRFAAVCRWELAGFDLILERSSWTSYGGVLAARDLKMPLIMEYNGDPLHDLASKRADPHGLQRQISIAIMQRTLNSPERIIATGTGWKENLVDLWGINPQRIQVIENGTTLVDLLDRDSLRSFQEHTSDPLRICFLGGFYAWQGTLQAVRAFHRLIQGGIQAQLVMIGSGQTLAETEALARQLGVQDQVRFTGMLPLDQYASILARSDVGLSPYCGRKEYSGLKLFDYKAAGLATIASGEDGQPLILRDGETGLIVPPCDEEALAGALLDLATHREKTRQIGQAARIEAEEQHSWRHTVEELEGVFHNAIQAA
jgi:glycosyltransferase involved in cell wall biosynthesis